MKSAASSEQRAAGWRKIIVLCLLLISYCSLNCSIPNLEPPECTDARNTVREFYSYHFGNDMKPSAVNLKQREKFLTEGLKQQLKQQPETSKDYFTQTDDYPKAFRVGRCKVEGENKTVLGVLLFWKDDQRDLQKEVQVEALKENNNWLINKVWN
jgi:hypothetical protein